MPDDTTDPREADGDQARPADDAEAGAQDPNADAGSQIGADLIHTNMEVLLEGGLAARALRMPHVLHYRGNTLDEPKWVFDALVSLWAFSMVCGAIWLVNHVY